MREKAVYFLLRLPQFSLVLTVCLLPLVFTTLTADFYELPKTVFLTLFLTIFIFGWLVISGFQGNIKIIFSPITYLLTGLVLWTTGATIFSVDQNLSYSSWLRNFSDTLLSLFFLMAFFIALTSLMRKTSTIKKVFTAINISTTFIALLGILSALKIYFLPFREARAQFFTPVSLDTTLSGMVVVLGAIVGLGLLWQTFKRRRSLYLGYLSFSLIISVAYLTLLNSGILFALLLTGVATFLLLTKKYPQTIMALVGAVFFLGIFFLVFRLLLFPDLKVPSLAKLPISEASRITTQTMIGYPLFGSGPATFDHDFRLFKSREFNKLPIFKVNFETSGSRALDQIATIGLIGFILSISLYLVTLGFLIKTYRQTPANDPLKPLLSLLISLNIVSVLTFLFLPTNITLFFFTFTFLGLTNALLKNFYPGIFKEIKISFKDIGWLLTIILMIFFGYHLNLIYKITLSSYLSQKTNSAEITPEQAYNYLLQAVRINKKADFLHRQFSLTNLALASGVVKNETLTKDKKVELAKELANQALNEAKAAATVSPGDSRNWKLYGSVLLQLQPLLTNQESFITDKLENAKRLEPGDPDIYVNLGLAYMFDKQFETAIAAIKKGLEIKADYPALHLQLAETYFAAAMADKASRTSLLTEAKKEYEITLGLLKEAPQKEGVKKKLEQINTALNTNR